MPRATGGAPAIQRRHRRSYIRRALVHLRETVAVAAEARQAGLRTSIFRRRAVKLHLGAFETSADGTRIPQSRCDVSAPDPPTGAGAPRVSRCPRTLCDARIERARSRAPACSPGCQGIEDRDQTRRQRPGAARGQGLSGRVGQRDTGRDSSRCGGSVFSRRRWVSSTSRPRSSRPSRERGSIVASARL